MAKRTKPALSAPVPTQETILPADITTVMENSYGAYAAAVVIGRAIPDVRDGLKPVHRRILYAMAEGGYDWSNPHRKSARVVGDVMGKFHPHGDSSIYDALARLAQPWSLSVPLIDGQGNFGSADGDKPAAMRYTEARLSTISKALLSEIRQETIDFQPNYDEQELEPVVLPAAFPNILVNGGSGIAVGLASSIPTHNFAEVVAATRWRLANPDGDLEEVLTLLPAPDYPTGGRIMGRGGVRKAYETGRGTHDLEATVAIGKDGKTPILVYTDMPYGALKPAIQAKISALMLKGDLPEVVASRDESDRNGVRFVVELKPDADPEQVDARLKTLTDLRVSISMNFTALDGTGVPREMGLLEILDRWIAFRASTLRRRSIFELRKARDRGRLLFGRIAALSIIDKVIALIRKSASPAEAIEALMAIVFKRSDFEDLVDLMGTEAQKAGKTFHLTRTQAEDILAIRLARLTGMEREALAAEGRECAAEVARLSTLLNTQGAMLTLMDQELAALAASPYALPRRTVVLDDAARVARTAATSVEIRLPKTPLWIVEGLDGTWGRSAKPVALDVQRHRRVLVAHTHARLAFFTDRGQAYGLAAADLPDLDAKGGEGRLLPGLLGYSLDGAVVATVLVDDARTAEGPGGVVLTFVSKDSSIRRTALAEFASIPTAGKVAMKLAPTDPSIAAVLEERPGDADVFLATAQGKVLRFPLSDVRVFAGRGSRGMTGMKLAEGDTIASALLLPEGSPDAVLADAAEADWTKGKNVPGPVLIQICTTGHLKRTPAAAYRRTGRATKGSNDKGPAKTIGDVLAVIVADSEQHRLYWPDDGQVIPVSEVRRTGKASTGGKPFDAVLHAPMVLEPEAP
jgi:DNA gyrase subunit A